MAHANIRTLLRANALSSVLGTSRSAHRESRFAPRARHRQPQPPVVWCVHAHDTYGVSTTAHTLVTVVKGRRKHCAVFVFINIHSEICDARCTE